MKRFPLVAALAVLGLWTPLVHAGEVPITFKGKKFTPDKLHPDLDSAQKEAIALLADWAKRFEYRMDFDAQGKLLLVTSKSRSRTPEALKVIGKTQAWFEEVLPAPARAPDPKNPAPDPAKKPEPPPIPEDPDDGKGGGSAAYARSQGPATGPVKPKTSWGSGSIVPDSKTAVMIILRNEKDYGTLLTDLAQDKSSLAEWVEIARKHTGFVMEEPLAGAYVENAEGQEEWSPDHELVNRVAQLMTLRRFGQQPNWIVQGIAWEAEIAFDGALYCFPYRKEFVFATEHTAWPLDVKNLMKDRVETPLEMAEVAGWKRTTWDANAAKLSWALVHQLLAQAPGKLSSCLEDLRRYRDEKDRRVTSPTSWERIPGWDVPADQQLATLRTHFGEEVLKTAAAGMRNGKDKAAKPASGEKSGARAR